MAAPKTFFHDSSSLVEHIKQNTEDTIQGMQKYFKGKLDRQEDQNRKLSQELGDLKCQIRVCLQGALRHKSEFETQLSTFNGQRF